ncbi:hypothetical protein FV241_28040 [Methylobacterium sp. WL2]|nr:hypothetical protein FVA80_21650 [Methylobacterium sp. WL1]TXN53477.1 hypothetical protein FV241_28040 [Methylobacterium sp. WL2]
MRRSLHTDREIAFLLDEAARGIPIADICASAHVSLGTFYRWRRRLGGLGLPPFGGPGSKLVHRRSRDDGGVSERP